MLSIRMRASKKDAGSKDADRETHISGAEGIYSDSKMDSVVTAYLQRALDHPRGRPDKVVITVERVRRRPIEIRSLPVSTLRCRTVATARQNIGRLLASAHISSRAIRTALSLIDRDRTMRGAYVVRALSGRRAEPDRSRGIRVSGLGIGSSALRSLSGRLGWHGIDTVTVREALVLASKVASCPPIVAELCLSDDPDYTTGYVASKELGYVRIPHIKRSGDRRGGRVFFLEEGAAIKPVLAFLEETPTLVTRISECRGERTADELIDRHHR